MDDNLAAVRKRVVCWGWVGHFNIYLWGPGRLPASSDPLPSDRRRIIIRTDVSVERTRRPAHPVVIALDMNSIKSASVTGTGAVRVIDAVGPPINDAASP